MSFDGVPETGNVRREWTIILQSGDVILLKGVRRSERGDLASSSSMYHESNNAHLQGSSGVSN